MPNPEEKKGKKKKGKGAKDENAAAKKQKAVEVDLQEQEHEETEVEKEFTILQQGFDEVLKQLTGEQGVVKIKDEYHRVLKALRLALANERRLVMRGYNINNEIEPNKMLLDAVLNMSEEDQLVVETLKKELERILKMIDTSHDREKETRANTYVLKNEIATFAKLIEESAKKQGDESSIFELVRLKDNLTAQRDEMQLEIDELRVRCNRLQKNEERLTSEAETALRKVAELEKELVGTGLEIREEMKRRRQVEKEIRMMRANVDSNEGDMKQLKSQLEQQTADKARFERIARDMKTSLDRSIKDGDTCGARLNKLQGDYSTMEISNQSLLAENFDMKETIKAREKVTVTVIQDNIKLHKHKDELQRKLHTVETLVAQFTTQRDTYKSNYSDTLKTVDLLKKKLESETKRADIVSHERDMMLKELLKPNAELQVCKDMLAVHESSIRQKDMQIIRLEKDAALSQRLAAQLEKARDEHLRGEIKQYNKVKLLMKQIQEKDIQVSDSLKHLVSASDDKLKAGHSAISGK